MTIDQIPTHTMRPRVLGLRANAGQFALLVGVNALVGGMIGQERTVLPLMAERLYGISSLTAMLTFLLAFGAVKAITNLIAGACADRLGRKPVLVTGWLIAVPVPFLLMWAPSWTWIIVANMLLGMSQGLTWSMTIIMKIDLVGRENRGLAMGLNEAAGYGAVAVAAAATGYIGARAGLQPEPFFLGLAFVGLGLGLSALLVRETHPHVELENTAHDARVPSRREVFLLTTVRERALSACSQAGLVNNLNDGMAWGLLPVWFAREGLSVAAVGALAAVYPAVWGVGQLGAGALSDRIGRKGLIVTGMLVQAVAIGSFAATRGFVPWFAGSALLGIGTAMVYPTLLAAISDVAEPRWRASAIGVYRFWRDAGFAVGAVLAGLVADAAGIETAIWLVAALTFTSGLVVHVRMYETAYTDPRPVLGA
ncbi:MAG TPA: MFS transporter [Actinomycetota bacterium]|nr:MFS transporter [Actinomycetota bacterium]